MASEVKRSDSPSVENKWKERSIAKRDWIIREVAIAIITTINLAALGVCLTYFIMYVNVPGEAIIASPLIAGAIGALIYLGYETYGFNKANYKEITNPAIILGKLLTYTFFGPVVILKNFLDRTRYHNPMVTRAVSHRLTTAKFETIVKYHGRHFKNLTRYGFVSADHLPKMRELALESMTNEKNIKKYKKKIIKQSPERYAIFKKDANSETLTQEEQEALCTFSDIERTNYKEYLELERERKCIRAKWKKIEFTPPISQAPIYKINRREKIANEFKRHPKKKVKKD